MVDIFIFILFSFSSSHSFLAIFTVFCWLWMSSSSSKKEPLKQDGKVFLPGCKLFRVSHSESGGAAGVQFSTFCGCDFSLSFKDEYFFWLLTNPTSLICFSSLPIPSNNSHIGYLRKGDRLCFVSPHSNLPHHLTNSCFSLSFIPVFFLWIASVFSHFDSRRILIPPPRFWSLVSSLHPFLSFM